MTVQRTYRSLTTFPYSCWDGLCGYLGAHRLRWLCPSNCDRGRFVASNFIEKVLKSQQSCTRIAATFDHCSRGEQELIVSLLPSEKNPSIIAKCNCIFAYSIEQPAREEKIQGAPQVTYHSETTLAYSWRDGLRGYLGVRHFRWVCPSDCAPSWFVACNFVEKVLKSEQSCQRIAATFNHCSRLEQELIMDLLPHQCESNPAINEKCDRIFAHSIKKADQEEKKQEAPAVAQSQPLSSTSVAPLSQNEHDKQMAGARLIAQEMFKSEKLLAAIPAENVVAREQLLQLLKKVEGVFQSEIEKGNETNIVQFRQHLHEEINLERDFPELLLEMMSLPKIFPPEVLDVWLLYSASPSGTSPNWIQSAQQRVNKYLNYRNMNWFNWEGYGGKDIAELHAALQNLVKPGQTILNLTGATRFRSKAPMLSV